MLWRVTVGLLAGLLLAVGMLLLFAGTARPSFADSLLCPPTPTATSTATPAPTATPCVAVAGTVSLDPDTTNVLLYGLGLTVLFSAAAVVASWSGGRHG